MTAFVISDKQVWGRPVGVATAKDDSLLVTDDGSGTIWRISYKKTIRKLNFIPHFPHHPGNRATFELRLPTVPASLGS
jgi:hypothetical protein